MQTFDAIVLGMGAMGAAATYQLAKRGVRVLRDRSVRSAAPARFDSRRNAHHTHSLWQR